MEGKGTEQSKHEEKSILQQTLVLSSPTNEDCRENNLSENIEKEKAVMKEQGSMIDKSKDNDNKEENFTVEDVGKSSVDSTSSDKQINTETEKERDKEIQSEPDSIKTMLGKMSDDPTDQKVCLNIPKIPSVVVRNENNDIIEQVNEPLDDISKHASIRQTLKSKIMEKSKSLDKSQKLCSDRDKDKEKEGLETDKDKVISMEIGTCMTSSSSLNVFEKDADVSGADYNQFNVKMPSQTVMTSDKQDSHTENVSVGNFQGVNMNPVQQTATILQPNTGVVSSSSQVNQITPVIRPGQGVMQKLYPQHIMSQSDNFPSTTSIGSIAAASCGIGQRNSTLPAQEIVPAGSYQQCAPPLQNIPSQMESPHVPVAMPTQGFASATPVTMQQPSSQTATSSSPKLSLQVNASCALPSTNSTKASDSTTKSSSSVAEISEAATSLDQSNKKACSDTSGIQTVDESSKSRNCDSPMLNQFIFFKCDKCIFKTRIRQNFRKHYSQHLSYRPYSCNYCKFRTYSRCLMPHHMKVHPGCDQKGFLYFPDAALDKAIEFHCDDCKEVKWVNDQELQHLKKDILIVQQKFSSLKRKSRDANLGKGKVGEGFKVKDNEGKSGIKRKLEESESGEVRVKKKRGRKPKSNVENTCPQKDIEENKHENENSDTEEDEDASNKKIPNYEIVDPTNILETPKRVRKFKTLFDPTPVVHRRSFQQGSECPDPVLSSAQKSSKLKCRFCPYKSDSPIGLRRHAFWRHNQRIYNCGRCSFKDKSKQEVLKHFGKEHPDERHPIINRTFQKTQQEIQQEMNMSISDKENLDEENNDFEDASMDIEEKSEREFKGCSEERSEVDEDKDNDVVKSEPVEEKDAINEESRVSKHRVGKLLPVKNKFLFKCTHCEYKSNVQGVQRHMLRSHNICRYLCGSCDFESSNETEVKEHFSSSHPDMKPNVFRGLAKLDSSHQKPITDVSNNKKQRKSFQIKTLKKAKNISFQQLKLKNDPKRNMPAECPVCDFKSLYSGVQRHIYMFHGLGKWQCGHCGIQLFNKATTIEHSLNMHSASIPSVMRSFIEVEKVKELQDMNAIIVDTHGKIKIVLSDDGLPISSPDRQQSKEIRTPAKKDKDDFVKDTQCPECNFVSSLKGVKRHLLMIHKICRWQCKLCGFESLDKFVTLEHSVDMHEGVDPKIVRAFVDIDRYKAEKSLNASTDEDLMPVLHKRRGIFLHSCSDSESNDGDGTENLMELKENKSAKPDAPTTICKDTKSKSTFSAIKSPLSSSPVSESPKKKLPKSRSGGLKGSGVDHTSSPSPDLGKKRTKTLIPLDPPQNVTTADLEAEQPVKKKRGRPKGSGSKSIVTAQNKQDSSSVFVVRPKELNHLQQGFSCVYCVYAAPLRHQVRLHCYDKHTNHPACLMEFKVDNQCYRSDRVMSIDCDQSEIEDGFFDVRGKKMQTDNVYSDGVKLQNGSWVTNGKQDDTKKGRNEEKVINEKKKDMDGKSNNNITNLKSEVGSDIKMELESKCAEKSTKVKERDGESTDRGESNINVKSGNDKPLDDKDIKAETVCERLDSYSTHTNQDMDVDELQISEIFENGKRYKSNRRQKKKFNNPLKMLVKKLRAGRINLEDPFHGTLDEVDSILFQFGVRTLNMDMLTQQQFSNFISKFGADLQPA